MFYGGARVYLTMQETEKIILATAGAKNSLQDRCMIMLAFYHGLRVSELTGLKVRSLDIDTGRIYIRRLKNGFSTIHPLQPEECNLLAQWLKIIPNSSEGWLFPSMKGNRISRQYIYKLFRGYGDSSGITTRVYPHMLRHTCGYELAEQGLDTRLIQDYRGHRNIRHTVHYTAGNSVRFARAWESWRLFADDNDGIV